MSDKLHFTSKNRKKSFKEDAEILNNLNKKQYDQFLSIFDDGEKFVDLYRSYSSKDKSEEVSDILEINNDDALRLLRLFRRISNNLDRDDPKSDFFDDLVKLDVKPDRFEVLIDSIVANKDKYERIKKYKYLSSRSIPYIKAYTISTDLRYEIKDGEIIDKAPSLIVSLNNTVDSVYTFQLSYYDLIHFINKFSESLEDIELIIKKEGLEL
ncbi:MAG: hypothetical protein NWE89_01270 [Candidatus Bathyarchaeota archaeon]|nr:hypothetical protein [Candidatus Bathyarchaeota archaeon]